MKKIKDCYSQKNDSSRNSFTVESHCRRLYLSNNFNMVYTVGSGRIYFVDLFVPLYAIKRKKA